MYFDNNRLTGIQKEKRRGILSSSLGNSLPSLSDRCHTVIRRDIGITTTGRTSHRLGGRGGQRHRPVSVEERVPSK